jgi:hypothetical protein
MTAEEKIIANARMVVDKFNPLWDGKTAFGHDLASVKWVEGFIERQRNREDFRLDTAEVLMQMLGCYLGECVIRSYGGEWRQHDGQWGVFFDDSNAVFPFNKARKQFEHGVSGGDSIVGFITAIPEMFGKGI